MDQRKHKPTRITIPLSELGEQLADAAGLKAEMAALLKDLEVAAAHVKSPVPGGWRHDPAAWQMRHKA